MTFLPAHGKPAKPHTQIRDQLGAQNSRVLLALLILLGNAEQTVGLDPACRQQLSEMGPQIRFSRGRAPVEDQSHDSVTGSGGI